MIPVVGRTYRHYKGTEYTVLALGTHTETHEPLVVYHPRRDPATVWVRPVSDWKETVDTPTGEQRRFERLRDSELI
jgi:hypothetical protein